ncbi:MAG TPA: AbrB/MazE/SpoVT family DNA-binding domain-containing protein [Candidatus Nanoarchaeia archaeon]|nr:AbrB/MazE/SpoVT family DNA-binding domain-containing protein [Candidatus Nanoarchaeia archaeon]
MIATISKGQQITIPAEMRHELDLHEGSRVEIQRKGKDIVISPIDVDLKTLFKEAKNRKPKRNLTAEQMDRLIEHEVLRQ